MEKITSIHRLNVTFMIISGFSEEYIAQHALPKPISIEEYHQLFNDEILNGERRLNQEMAELLFRKAKSGNVLAITTWLKTRAKWSETTKLETDRPLLVRIENTVKNGDRNN